MQLDQMAQGLRKVVMIPKANIEQGFVPAKDVPAEVAFTSDHFGNRYYFDRSQGVKKDQIRKAVMNNTLPELLGGPGGMGAPDKSAIPPEQAVVVKATAPDGTEVQSTATTPEVLPQTLAATEPIVPPGGSVQVEPPLQAVAERQGAGILPRLPVQPLPQPSTTVSKPTVTPIPQPGQELFRGSWDVPLNENGVRDAQDAARRTAGQVNEIWASPLGRAQETARAVAGTNPQAKVFSTDALRPIAMGAHEGEAVTPERIADLTDHIRNRPDEPMSGVGKHSGQPGQSFNDFYEPLIDHIIGQVERWSENPESRILNVTHYRDLRAIDSWLKAGGTATKDLDLDAMTSKGKEKPGDLYRLNMDRGELVPATDMREPGIYILRHGETAANEGAAAPNVAKAQQAKPSKPPAKVATEPPKPVQSPGSVGSPPPEEGTAQSLFAKRRAREQAQQTGRPTYADYLRESERNRRPGEPPMTEDAWNRRQKATDAVEEFFKSEEGVMTPGQAAQHINSILQPRLIDPVRKLVAPQTRGDIAKSGAGSLRDMEGKRMRFEAKAKAAFNGFRKFFDSKPQTFQVNSPNRDGVHAFDVIDAIERGNVAQLDPTSQQYAKTLKTEMDYWKGELQKRGLLSKFKDDYFHRSWVEPKAKGRSPEFFRGRKPLEGSKQYTKKRTYEFMSDAMHDPDFTLVPKFSNPVDYTLDYVAQAAKHVTAHDVFTEWQNAGYLPFYRNPKDAPPGYARINDNIFTIFGPKYGAVKLPPNVGNTIKPNDVRVLGRREMGNYYAPEELARVANNFLGEGAAAGAGAPLFNAWMAVKNAYNSLNLGFSAFHGMTTVANSSFSDMALGIRELTAGKPLKAAKYFAEGAVPFRSVVRDVIRGTYLEKVYDGKIKNDPLAEAVVKALEMAGGSPHQSVWSPDAWYNGMKKSWNEGSKGVAALKALNPLLWSEQFPVTRAIMEKLVPRVKLAAFERALAQEVERHPGMGVDEARERFGAIWDSMDNVMGQLNQKNMLMAAPVRDFMNGVMGRPGWTVGNLRMVLGGTSDFIRGEGMTHRGAQLLASIVGAALINGVISTLVSALNKKEDDEPLSWRDFIAPRSGGYTEDGRPARMILPFYLSKDYRSWVSHPVRTAKAKLTPPLMIAGDLLDNRDFFRHKIYGEGGIGFLKYLTQGLAPYSVMGTKQNYERDQSLGQLIAPHVGVMPAPAELSRTKAEQVVAEWREEHQPEMRSPSTAHSRAKQKVFTAAKNDFQKGVALGQDYVAKEELTVKEVRDALARAGKSPLLNDVKAMNGEGAIRTVMKVYEAATPEERKLIEPEVKKKLYNARAKPWEWDDATRKRAKRFLDIEPIRRVESPSAVGIGR
jgi:broad specificity phosphatase PhoE